MKRIIWGLAILIIPAFVLWGAGAGRNKGKGPNYAGKIFDRKISFEEYLDMWRITRDYLLKDLGANVPPEFIDQMTWNRIILLEEAKRKNIVVKEVEVAARIASFPVFQKEGKFDKKLYKSLLGGAAKGFEKRLEDDMRISRLKEEITHDVSVTDEETKEDYKNKSEQIKASYISIPFSNLEKDVVYEETNLSKFHEENKDSFRKPEAINVKYIETTDEDLAYKVLDTARHKKNLDKIALSFELETKETGFFSMQEEIPDIGWSFEFTKRAFELENGEIANVLTKIGENFYIIQLEERIVSYIPKFKEVKEDVKELYVKNESIKLSEKKAKKLHLTIANKIKNGKTFEHIVNKMQLEKKETDFITRSGYISGLGPARDFIEECLSSEATDITRPIKMQESWVIAKSDEYQGIDEDKFLEEKEDFKENLLLRKKELEFNKWFGDLKKEAKFVAYTSEE